MKNEKRRKARVCRAHLRRASPAAGEEQGEIDQRREVDLLEPYYGSMTGAFPHGYLRRLRAEWD